MYGTVSALSESLVLMVLANVMPVWDGLSRLKTGGSAAGCWQLAQRIRIPTHRRLTAGGCVCRTPRRSADAPRRRGTAARRHTDSASWHGTAAGRRCFRWGGGDWGPFFRGRWRGENHASHPFATAGGRFEKPADIS